MTSELSRETVSVWITDLKQGEDRAAEALWNRYFEDLVRVAHRKLGTAPQREFDAEDIAISVFDTLYRGAKAGRFHRLQDRDDLWALLVAIARKKAASQVRRQTSQKRGGGFVRGESVLFKPGASQPVGFEHIASESPSPEFLALMDDELQQKLSTLRDDTLRRIALMRMEGFSNRQIAESLGVTERSVERKLNLIRSDWADEFDQEDARPSF